MLYPRGVIVREIHAAHYRSLRSIRFPTGRLTVFVGANGVGKTNLYRALQLLQASAAGTLARELAAEGGMNSASWAGKRRVGEPARIKLSAGFGEPALDGQHQLVVDQRLGEVVERTIDGDQHPIA